MASEPAVVENIPIQLHLSAETVERVIYGLQAASNDILTDHFQELTESGTEYDASAVVKANAAVRQAELLLQLLLDGLKQREKQCRDTPSSISAALPSAQ